MKKATFYLVLLTALLCVNSSNAQIIRGFLIDENSKEVLQRATVYQDGTTNVTFTDDKGFFQLDLRGLKNTLVVQFIGYESKRIENPLQFANQTLKLSLNVESFILDEVVISRQHSFTRHQMLVAFRREFLGTTLVASKCKIVNEKDIIFTYDLQEQKLMATSKRPLKIINKYLEYEMNFDLNEFSVYFWNAKNLERNSVGSTYFDGYSYYVDLSKRGRAEKKRYETYLGSIPHFIHSLAYGKLKQQNYTLIVDGRFTDPTKYFEITDTIQVKKIKLIKKPQKIVRGTVTEKMLKNFKNLGNEPTIDSVGVVRINTFFTPYYNRKKLQSRMDFDAPAIYVDVNGNYMPISGVMFAGYMGDLRAADLLPLEYLLTIKDRVAVDENQ